MTGEKIKLCWLAGWLLWWSMSDLRRRSVMLWQLLLVLGIGVLWQWQQGELFCYDTVGGVLVGLLALVISCLSRGGFGIGDSLALLCLGLYLGAGDTLVIWMLALILCSLAGLILIWVKKKSWKWKMPFLPYATAAFVILKIMQWREGSL